jgi:hypothetical protein
MLEAVFIWSGSENSAFKIGFIALRITARLALP